MKGNRPSAFKRSGLQEITTSLSRVCFEIQGLGEFLKLGVLKVGVAVPTCLLSPNTCTGKGVIF